MDPRKDHEFLHEHHSIRQQNILSFLQEHLPESVPLVIECVAKAETSTDELREKIENEIKYLRRDWQPRTLKTDYSSSNR
jgi:translation initiation factor 2 gamma subunit (eIF-2gamma)